MSIRIVIDDQSGFCFGVVTAIRKAEEELARGGKLYCLGDIVHNSAEVVRLEKRGLNSIDHTAFLSLSNAKILLRAHGEPPETYLHAKANNIQIIDATCPVVLKLQQRIKATYDAAKASDSKTQIVIYGRLGHAEVNGLVGQTNGEAIVVENVEQLDKIDFALPVSLYSQTTKSLEGFSEIVKAIGERMQPGVNFEYQDTICRQVANRVEHIRNFACAHDVILFVAGEKSSNGKVLFGHCLEQNRRSHLLEEASQLKVEWLLEAKSVGICGATSTPRWLMEEVAQAVDKLVNV